MQKLKKTKMEVVRDSLWERCLADAAKMYRISKPDEKCVKLANATWVMKKRYEEAANKKNNQKVHFITDIETSQIASENKNVSRVKTANICSAITMSGKRCSFKAVCGDFCKKHRVKGEQLGLKVDVSKIKISD
jgi:hypothetical protein